MSGKLPPPSHTPLVALPVLVLDLETTGLDVRVDRIVQIGAVALEGNTSLDEPRIDTLVNPGVAIPADASRIHGLDDDAVADAPCFRDVAAQLHDALSGRVVIGHHIGFDIGVLRHEAARADIAWRDPPTLDVAQLVGALAPRLHDLDLDTVAAELGVAIENRHTAIGDCEATAEIWQQVMKRLRAAGIRTLGEAQSFAARRSDLTLARAHAGWDATPGEAAPLPDGLVLPRIDSHAFERRLDELMSAPPIWIDDKSVVREAARTMVSRGIGALLVGNGSGTSKGIVTERDLLRAAAEHDNDLDNTPVVDIMSHPVASMHAEEMLYRALARMDRLGIRHLAVVDDSGHTVGIVSQRDLLHHRARAAEVVADRLAVAEDAPSLAAAYAHVPEAATRLVAEGLGGVEVARVISAELRGLTARAAELAAAAVEAEGHGAAPAPWTVIVLGSGGRGESLLGADQDNAVIHAGSSDDDAWFERMGEHLRDILDAAGLPLCKGGIMVANPQWRGTSDQWQSRVEEWLSRSNPKDLLNVDIFFDLVAVTGHNALATELHNAAVQAAASAPTFIAMLADSAIDVAPRFTLFGRLPTDDDGRVDLKRDGLLPLVGVARTLALRVGSTARATPQRLREAASAGRLAEADADALIELHQNLLARVLNQQLVDLADGRAPSGRVAIDTIARHARRELLSQLKRLDAVVGALRGAVSSG